MTTFAVKTQALTAYAGVLSGGGHSIDLSKAFGTTAFNYVESYVPVPHDDGDLYDEVYKNNEKVVSALKVAMAEIGSLCTLSANNLDASAVEYGKRDDSSEQALDAAFKAPGKVPPLAPGISKASGLKDPVPELNGTPSKDAPVPNAVQWAIDKGGWVSITGVGLKIASLFGLDPVGDLTKAVAGDYGELAQAGHAIEALAEFERVAASTMASGLSAMSADWTGNAAQAAEAYFTAFANALEAHAGKLDTVADKYALLVQACAQAAEALGGLLATAVDRVLILVAEIAAAGCLASVPGINAIIAIVGAYQVWITKEAVAAFLKITGNVMLGVHGLITACTAIASELTSDDVASMFPAKPYSNASLPA